MNQTSLSILPLDAITARAWAHGWIGDADAMAAKPGPLAAMLFMELESRAAFKAAIPAMLELYRRGARVLLCRTKTPELLLHMTKWGAQATYREASGSLRLISPPEISARYFGRMERHKTP